MYNMYNMYNVYNDNKIKWNVSLHFPAGGKERSKQNRNNLNFPFLFLRKTFSSSAGMQPSSSLLKTLKVS